MFDEIKLRLSESSVESSMFFLKLPDFNILNISLSPSSPYLPNNVSSNIASKNSLFLFYVSK